MSASTPTDPVIQMNVRIKKSLRDEIDERRAVVRGGISRDLWVANALRFALASKAPAALGTLTNSRGRTAPPPRSR